MHDRIGKARTPKQEWQAWNPKTRMARLETPKQKWQGWNLKAGKLLMLQQMQVRMLHKPQILACSADSKPRHAASPLCPLNMDVFCWTRLMVLKDMKFRMERHAQQASHRYAYQASHRTVPKTNDAKWVQRSLKKHCFFLKTHFKGSA